MMGMTNELQNVRVAFLVANEGIEEVELTQPWRAVMHAGGVANPDLLRRDAPAVDFLMAMFEAGRPVAAICHGPWTLIEGDLVAGRTLTSWPSLQSDLRNAGAYWVDRDVVVCRLGINTLVTSRGPDDLGAFCREMTAAFAS